ncbi:MAG: hypothetical protein ACREJO_13125 [Phycisphaerales bacterium]
MPTTSPTPEPHDCPRCGYDQSGLAVTWTDRCPLKGVCSECGLEFAWVDVLRPARNDLAWFYEHATGWGPRLRLAWRTWRVAINPVRFWSLVRLPARLNPWRAAIWPALIYACAHAAYATARTISMLVSYYAFVQSSGPGVGAVWSLEWIDYVEPWVNPLMHVEYTPTGRTLVFASDPSVVMAGGLSLLAAAATVPLMLMVLSSSRRISRVRAGHILRAAAFSLAWVGIFPLLWAAYFLEEVVALALGSGLSTYRTGGSWTMKLMTDLWPLIAAPMVAWFGWWWYQAIARGFQLPKSGTVWMLLMVAAALAALIPALLHPDVQWWMSRWKVF